MIKGRNLDKDVMVCGNKTVFDLSGSPTSEMIVFRPQNDIQINSVTFLYEEASSSDAGILIKLGNSGDDDAYFSLTTEISKDAGYSKTYNPSELISTKVPKGTPVVLTNAGGKTGTGTVWVSISYTIV